MWLAPIALRAPKNANATIASLRSEQKRVEGDIARLKGELRRYVGVRSPVEVQAALDAIVEWPEQGASAYLAPDAFLRC
jgi:hypothetical protein